MAQTKEKGNAFVRFLKFLFPCKGDSAGEVIRKLVFLASVVALIVCGVYFANRFLQRKNYSDTARLASLVEDSDEVEKDGKLEKYKKLSEINKEFAGWLTVDGTGIDVPVVQTDDNETYLRKDFYGNYSVYGAPFLDYRNNVKSLFEQSDLVRKDRNITVYGHNMLDNMVFAELLKYKELDFYKKHPLVHFNTLYGDTSWKIIAAFLTNSTDDQDNNYCLEYNFVDCDEDRFMPYISELAKRTYVNTGVDVNSTDTLLTLSTCDKDIIPEGRFVIVARLVRQGESEKVDVSKSRANENIKFPQGYYNKKNAENPYKNDGRWTPYRNSQ